VSSGEIAVASAQWYVTARALAIRVRKRWMLVALFGVMGAAIATAVVLILPSYFRSGAAFQAETNTPTQLGGALAGIASQVSGIQLGGQPNGQFFADLIGTDAVLQRVARASYPWRGSTTPLSKIFDLTDETQAQQEYNAVRKLRRSLDVGVNFRTDVVRFSIEARTPELAQALAETTLVALNEMNIELRQARALAERRFTSGRADASRRELDSAEQRLANFYQMNRALGGSPRLQMEEARLRRVVDMAQQVFVQLRLQEEQAAVQEVRNTPAISVIDPPLLPVKRSFPQRRLGVLFGALAGIAVALTSIALAESREGR